MAANFKVGENVKLVTTAPTGPVQQLIVDSQGNITYLVQWTDADGNVQQTWFSETDLAAA
jgi:uncharacterized protein YodC (DUF2158 family)